MVPRRDLWTRRSVRMRARTGKAVTESEIPIKSAKLRNGTWLLDINGYRYRASVVPMTKGTMMLAWEMASVEWPDFLNNFRSNSSPTMNM